MHQIKFSHTYLKMSYVGINGNSKAELLQALAVDDKDLSDAFIRYDTEFADIPSISGKITGYQRGCYELPKGKLILLIFKNSHGIFTTIRRWTPEKWKYYKGNEGSEFEVVRV